MSAPQIVDSLFTPQQLALEIEWLGIRDMFFGLNQEFQYIPGAIDLAAACEHPEARWLTTALAGKGVETRKQARVVFLGMGENDRALCFVHAGMEHDDLPRMRRSADLGYALAQGLMAWQTKGEDRFNYAKAAALQGERLGFFWLGKCFNDGEGCEKNLSKAKENFVIAAELGEKDAMHDLFSLLESSDSLRWRWKGRAARLRDSISFMRLAYEEVLDCVDPIDTMSSCWNAATIFEIGRAFCGHIDIEKETIFGETWRFDCLIIPANVAVEFYKEQLVACRRAVDEWSLFGIRSGVVKDIRVFIGKMIWDARHLSLFKLDLLGMYKREREKEAKRTKKTGEIK